ncbi:hypothetical protein GYMLUDRAFT_63175 [Collybiopsis luxurians FD-317 M1]|uniref:Uncharacterized protein n=1 Tax=Collybiopsis luxurians FD-317 M1 TaxID=944289 RepID=A0A0D0BX75_9AGAR|nr:hypothetical protein GYMLUDRAFT_63175 [Collybiopsis luxurians FD-317 M1]
MPKPDTAAVQRLTSSLTAFESSEPLFSHKHPFSPATIMNTSDINTSNKVSTNKESSLTEPAASVQSNPSIHSTLPAEEDTDEDIIVTPNPIVVRYIKHTSVQFDPAQENNDTDGGVLDAAFSSSDSTQGTQTEDKNAHAHLNRQRVRNLDSQIKLTRSRGSFLASQNIVPLLCRLTPVSLAIFLLIFSF